MKKIWFSGNYGVEFQMTLAQAKRGSHQGSCDSDVKVLVEELANELEQIDPVQLKRELADYGAWNERELANHQDNLERIVWLAAGNILDEAQS
jgi:hypothetical protein